MAEYQLSDKHRDWLRNDNRLPEARAFREGLEVEARTRKESIQPHLWELFETALVMCQNYTDHTPSQVAGNIYYIFHEPTRWERIKRRCKWPLTKLRAQWRKHVTSSGRRSKTP